MLNLRRDRLRARRAAFPYAKMIETKAEYLCELTAVAGSAGEKNRLGELKNAINAHAELFKVVKDNAIAEAKDMFDSDMSFTYKSLIDSLNRIGTDLTQAKAYTAAKGDRDNIEALTASALDAARRTQKGCQVFAGQLKELAGHYGQ